MIVSLSLYMSIVNSKRVREALALRQYTENVRKSIYVTLLFDSPMS